MAHGNPKNNREIDVNQLKKAGGKVISTSGEAFLRSSIAYGVEMAILPGLLGEGLKAVNPSVVGVVVTVVLGTIKNSILVAAGKMTSAEMGVQFVDTLVVSSEYLVSMKIGGVIVQVLFPELPGIGFAIGSLFGCSGAICITSARINLFLSAWIQALLALAWWK